MNAFTQGAAIKGVPVHNEECMDRHKRAIPNGSRSLRCSEYRLWGGKRLVEREKVTTRRKVCMHKQPSNINDYAIHENSSGKRVRTTFIAHPNVLQLVHRELSTSRFFADSIPQAAHRGIILGSLHILFTHPTRVSSAYAGFCERRKDHALPRQTQGLSVTAMQ